METANSTFRELTRKEHEFMARADRDLAARRQQNFMKQLKNTLIMKLSYTYVT